jgi:hypothetical protein
MSMVPAVKKSSGSQGEVFLCVRLTYRKEGVWWQTDLLNADTPTEATREAVIPILQTETIGTKAVAGLVLLTITNVEGFQMTTLTTDVIPLAERRTAMNAAIRQKTAAILQPVMPTTVAVAGPTMVLIQVVQNDVAVIRRMQDRPRQPWPQEQKEARLLLRKTAGEHKGQQTIAMRDAAVDIQLNLVSKEEAVNREAETFNVQSAPLKVTPRVTSARLDVGAVAQDKNASMEA